MRVLVLWADDVSPNLGVRALAQGSRALVQRVWPDAEVEFQNFGRGAAPMPIGSLRSLARERVTSRNGLLRWLRTFDLVVDTRSGDSFADIYGLRRLTIMSALAECAAEAGVPVVLGPQTIGPFSTRRGRALARTSMRRARSVMARDTASAAYAERLGRPVDVLTTDVVFALPEPVADPPRDVVLNVSGLLWNDGPHVDARQYRETLDSLYSQLVAAGREVTLLAHVLSSKSADDDVPAVQEFARRQGRPPEVIIPESMSDVRSAVASAQVVIGSRMHACLNALSVGTPAVPLAYSRKFAPLLGDLGWGTTVDLRTDADAASSVMRHLQDPGLAARAREVRDSGQATLVAAEKALRDL